MLYRIQSAAVLGIKAYLISVEVDLSLGRELNFLTVGLPMAVAILGAAGCVHAPDLSDYLILGELCLDGSLRPVKGTLSMAVMARERGIGKLVVPEANAREAAVVEGVRAYPARSLAHVVELLSGKEGLIPLAVDRQELLTQSSSYSVDFRDLRGQYQAKGGVRSRHGRRPQHLNVIVGLD